MPHGVPLSADAADVYGARARGSLSDHRHHAADAADSGELPVGGFSPQSRRADARNGDGFRARLSLADLRGGPARTAQSRYSAAACAAAGTRPPQNRADELSAALDAWNAGRL